MKYDEMEKNGIYQKGKQKKWFYKSEFYILYKGIYPTYYDMLIDFDKSINDMLVDFDKSINDMLVDLSKLVNNILSAVLQICIIIGGNHSSNPQY